MTKTARKPNAAKFKESLDRKTEAWIENTVRPYLESLLSIAQAKMHRHPLTFNDGMGMSTLYYEGESRPRRMYRLSESIEAVAYSITGPGGSGGTWRDLVNARDRRYAERFPELVEFMVCVQEIEEELSSTGHIGELSVR